MKIGFCFKPCHRRRPGHFGIPWRRRMSSHGISAGCVVVAGDGSTAFHVHATVFRHRRLHRRRPWYRHTPQSRRRPSRRIFAACAIVACRRRPLHRRTPQSRHRPSHRMFAGCAMIACHGNAACHRGFARHRMGFHAGLLGGPASADGMSTGRPRPFSRHARARKEPEPMQYILSSWIPSPPDFVPSRSERAGDQRGGKVYSF